MTVTLPTLPGQPQPAAPAAPQSLNLPPVDQPATPLVPPATQSDVTPSPVRTWPGERDVTALEQSVLATCVAVAVVDGAVVSVHAAATVTISVHPMVLPRAAAIRENIRLYTSRCLSVFVVS